MTFIKDKRLLVSNFHAILCCHNNGVFNMVKDTKIKKQSSFKNFTELLNAIDQNEKTKVFFLLKEGIDVNLTNENGRTPLMAAIGTNDLNMVKVIVEAGADLEMRARDKETALLYACRVAKNKEIVEYLIDKGADVKARNEYNDDALFIAAEYNKYWQITEFLLDTGHYNINDQGDVQNYTPLMAAARHNDFNTIALLIDRGASLHLKDKSGWTPIFHAAANTNDDPTNMLLMLRKYPELLFECAEKKHIRSIAEEYDNIKIACSIDGIFAVFVLGSKNSESLN